MTVEELITVLQKVDSPKETIVEIRDIYGEGILKEEWITEQEQTIIDTTKNYLTIEIPYDR